MFETEIISIITTFLYVLYAIYVFIYHRESIIGIAVTFFYAVISIYSTYLVISGAISPVAPISLLSSIYIFICFVVLSRPLNGIKLCINDKNCDILYYGDYLIIICNIYILVSILYEISYGVKSVNNYLSGNWLSIYYEMRGDNAIYYSSFYEKLLINFVNYIRIPALISAFILFIKKRKYILLPIALLAPFITALTNAIYISSRSDLFLITLQYGFIFMFFIEYFNKKQIYIASTVGLSVILIAYIVSSLITGSRFADDYTSSWVQGYFGDPQFTGNIIVTYTDSFYKGGYIAKNLYSYLGISGGQYHMPIDIGFSFQTLIATRFKDFGYVGTIVYLLVLTTIVKHMISGELTIAKLYIIQIYFSAVIIGCFYEINNDITFIMILIIYYLLKNKHLRI